MKVCLLTRFFDFRNAGLGRVSSEILRGLVKEGYSVRKVYTKGNSLYSYFFYTLVEIPIKLPRKGIDVYHAVTPMEGIWIPKDKSIVTFHDLFQITDPDKLGSGLGYSKWKNLIGTSYFRIAVNIAKRCRFITAVSEKTKLELIEYLKVPESKIYVIKSGIRPDLRPLPSDHLKFRVGYLGQLDRRKRINLLIEAFKKCELDELLIGGIGADREILEEMAETDKRIKFLGLIPDDELVNFYNKLNLFVMPSWLEGYGLPIVEAMACRLPVIVLADAHIPWEIKSRCIIVEDLEMTLGNENYLSNLLFHTSTELNYHWAKSHDWDKSVEEYLELYKEITNE